MRAMTLVRGVPRAALPVPRRFPLFRHAGAPVASPVFAGASRRVFSASAASATAAPAGRSGRSVLFVGFLWPEASSSAAGVRTMSLLRAFQSWGWRVHYLACARPNEHTDRLEASGVRTHHVAPNRGADFDAALAAAAPDAVVFDRFTAEEAFSFRVRAARPNAARVLDMQDLHALRYARHAALKRALKATTKSSGDGDAPRLNPVSAALAAMPEAGDEHLSRELASVHRCDLSLVCSPVELALLADRFRVPASKLVPASFFCEEGEEEEAAPGFDDRHGFVTIGTFYHPPNVDAVRWMRHEVWPLIRAELPAATMRVYGAYPTEAVRQLEDEKGGFLVKGFAPTVAGAMRDARVLLAPLRFGAGIKGKIVDAWSLGLPVVTTPVGAEGMLPPREFSEVPLDATKTSDAQKNEWGGRWCAADARALARDAVELHEDREAWAKARRRGAELIRELFPAEANLARVRDAVEALLGEPAEGFADEEADAFVVAEATTPRSGLERARARDYVGAALWHHTARSTEYFSRWIEMKETGRESSEREKRAGPEAAAEAREGAPLGVRGVGVEADADAGR